MIYPGWPRRQIDVAKGLVNSGKRCKEGRSVAPEVLLTNLPWPSDTPSLF